MARRPRRAPREGAASPGALSSSERAAWRDLRTGRFVQVEHLPGGPYRVFTKSGTISRTRRLPKSIRRTLVPTTISAARRPRHPATGRFITEAAEKKLARMTITDADLRRIIQTSPKFKRNLRRTKPSKRRRARGAMRYYLKKFLRRVRRGAREQRGKTQ